MFPLRDNIPLTRFPLVTVALVAINVIAYLLAIRHGGSFFGGPTASVAVHYGAIPYELTHPGKHCYLVSVHTLEGHLQHGRLPGPGRASAGEPRRRSPRPGRRCSRRCSCTAASCTSSATCCSWRSSGPPSRTRWGACASSPSTCSAGCSRSAAQVLADPDSTAPTLGASGAIAAVLGGYVVLVPARAHPQPRVHHLLRHASSRCPPSLLLGFWFLEQVLLRRSPVSPSPVGGGEGVAYFAPLGGFAFGLLAIGLLATRRRTSAAAAGLLSDARAPACPHDAPGRPSRCAGVHRRLRLAHVRRRRPNRALRLPACCRSSSSCCSPSASSARCAILRRMSISPFMTPTLRAASGAARAPPPAQAPARASAGARRRWLLIAAGARDAVVAGGAASSPQRAAAAAAARTPTRTPRPPARRALAAGPAARPAARCALTGARRPRSGPRAARLPPPAARGAPVQPRPPARCCGSATPTGGCRIASLTKMMTALLTVEAAPPDARVLVTRQAVDSRRLEGRRAAARAATCAWRACSTACCCRRATTPPIALAAARRRHASTAFVARMNAEAARAGAGLHALLLAVGLLRQGQLLLRGRPRRARPRRPRSSRASRASRAPTRPCCRSRSRAASSTSTTTTRCSSTATRA